MNLNDLIKSAEAELQAARAADQRARADLLAMREKAEAGKPVASSDVDRVIGARDATAARVASIEARVAELRREQADEDEQQRLASISTPTGVTYRGASSGSGLSRGYTMDAAVYTPDSARDGTSFLRDVATATLLGDVTARERLARNSARELDVRGLTARDGSTGNFSGIVVPAYLTDLVAPLARKGRPLAELATQHPLPAQGMTVNISRITTGSSVAAQTAEGAAVSEQDIDDTLLSVPVRTIAGQQDVSRQAVERGTGVDEVVVADLAGAYAAELDRQLLYGSPGSGEHQGLSSLSGLSAVTYTDADPTAAELYPKLFDLLQQVQAAVFAGATAFVMHPRRWWWLAAQVGTSEPFLHVSGLPTAQGGQVTGAQYLGQAGLLGPLPVILDANVSTTVSTNQDEVYAVTAPELHLWEDPNAPLLIRAEQPGAGNLMVKFVAYGFSAFTGGRYPAAHGKISGTGLAAPTF